MLTKAMMQRFWFRVDETMAKGEFEISVPVDELHYLLECIEQILDENRMLNGYSAIKKISECFDESKGIH